MKNRRKAVGVVAGLAVALTPVFIIYRFDQESSQRTMQARAELQSFGVAVTLKDFMAQSPSPHENAAPIYLPILDQIDKRALSKDLTAGGKSLSPKEIAMLDREKALLDRADEVRLRPRLWFNRAYEKGWATTMPELAHLKTLQKMIGRRAALEASRGETARAHNRLVTMTAIAEQCSQDPTYIGGLVSLALFRLRDRDSLMVALRTESPEDRLRIRRLVESAPRWMDIKKHLSGETYAYALNKPLEPEMTSEDSWLRLLHSMPFMMRRVTAVNLEELANIAARSQDGLSSADVKAIDDFYRNRPQDVLDYLAPRLTPVISTNSVSTEWQESYRLLILAALDVLVERAGGPPAKISTGYKLETKGEQFVILGPTEYALVGPNETSVGNVKGWRGFKP